MFSSSFSLWDTQRTTKDSSSSLWNQGLPRLEWSWITDYSYPFTILIRIWSLYDHPVGSYGGFRVNSCVYDICGWSKILSPISKVIKNHRKIPSPPGFEPWALWDSRMVIIAACHVEDKGTMVWLQYPGRLYLAKLPFYCITMFIQFGAYLFKSHMSPRLNKKDNSKKRK